MKDTSAASGLSLGGESCVSLIFVSDPGQDLDDEMTYIMLRHLVELKMVDVKGLIATLAPAYDRARLARGTLDTLGLFDVPVGLGTDGGDKMGMHKASTFEEWASSYMPRAYSERGRCYEPGRRLLHRLYREAEPRSLTLVVIASLKDPALFLRDNEELFVQKTREVVIMGGVKEWAKDGEGPEHELQPDEAHNNQFDAEASTFLYRRCQELGVRLIVVSRWAAYAAKMPRSCYDELASLGSSIGCRLRNAQRQSIESLWTRCTAPAGSEGRHGLPDRCDRGWFLKTFCGGRECERGAEESIWDLVEGFMQYDTIATLAAFPALRTRFFLPAAVRGPGGTEHLVIGRAERDHNVADPDGLSQFMIEGFQTGLALNHREKRQFVLVAQPRWNNRSDVLLMLTMFRSLYELGIVDCAGIVLSMISSGGEEGDSMLDEVKKLLVQLGASHVPVFRGEESEPNRVSDHLRTIYDLAPPSGVTLVVTGSVGDVANFPEQHPKLFRERTQSVVLLSGANKVERAEGSELEPDPVAQNNSIDLPASKRFFSAAQHLLVPLVVISRHCAGACNIPRTLFDALGKHGGALGSQLRDVQRTSIQQLWEAANVPAENQAKRRGLADRCDRDWFVNTFCPEGLKDASDIWENIGSFNVYAPLALLAALPGVLSKFAEGTKVQVRSVDHVIIGLSKEDPGLKDISGIRSLIFQSLFMGTRLNSSEFDLSPPGPIALAETGAVWHYDQSETALDWILTNRMGSAASMRSSF